MTKRTILYIIGYVILGALLVATGFWLGEKENQKKIQNLTQGEPLRERGSSYKFISPLLAYNTASSNTFKEYQPLETEIKKIIDEKKHTNTVQHVSIYYKNLSNGWWVGLDENEQFTPASLLKAVIMIAYYKQAESDPGSLEQKYVYTKPAKEELDSPFDVPSELITNTSYSVPELIEAMIINSDNGAKDLLLSYINRNSLNEVYTDLGLTNPDQNPDSFTISAKDYSLFFRILYNATYLSKPYSEKALQLLSTAAFAQGLRGGLPADILVAHKFGEHVTSTNGVDPTDVQLHDCGIIYKKNEPFLLCIMTKGNNVENLQSVIQDITHYIYDHT